MPITGEIGIGVELGCECVGGDCDTVVFAPGALRLQRDILAITGRADQVAASTRAGSLSFTERARSLGWSIADDAPDTPALDNLRALLEADTPVYGRPLIADAGSEFTETGRTRTYSAANVRGLLVKPILDDERQRGWLPAEIGEDRMERRYVEFRAFAGVIEGVVMRYGAEARIGDFTERFEPGALRYSDVIVNIMHKRGEPVARTGAGLTLTDGAELRARIEPPATAYGKRAQELIEAGILRGMSVEFVAQEERWEGSARIIERAELTGIGLVDRPAYPESTVAQRMAINRPMPPLQPATVRRAL